jgi:hypothetical protein
VLSETEFLLRLREKQRSVSDAKNRKRVGLGVRPGGKGAYLTCLFLYFIFYFFLPSLFPYKIEEQISITRTHHILQRVRKRKKKRKKRTAGIKRKRTHPCCTGKTRGQLTHVRF